VIVVEGSYASASEIREEELRNGGAEKGSVEIVGSWRVRPLILMFLKEKEER
jgi:hypothetical protein